MPELFLLAEIDGTSVAIASEAVESVIHVQDFIRVPRSDPLVAGIFALRSRVLTLIDTQYAVTGKSKPVPENALAVIAEIDGFHFGLIVGAVTDVISIEASQYEHAITPGPNWRNCAKSLVNIDGRIVVVLCPRKLIAGTRALTA
jgi:purine-binding chemotaxis protein CheW